MKALADFFIEAWPHLLPSQWAWLLLSGLLIGMAKGGVKGLTILAVPLLAATFGSKASTGIVLPMLLFGDVIAVHHYHAYVRWPYVLGLLPAAVVGIALAMWIGMDADEAAFDLYLAIVILLGLGLMLWQEFRPLPAFIIQSKAYAFFFGILGGFTTMIGNASGPVMSVYLLSTRLSKEAFIGTGAWFYLIVNLIKLPLQFFIWDNINTTTLAINLLAFPAIIVGLLLGVRLVNYLPEKAFRYFVMAMTLIISVRLLAGI